MISWIIKTSCLCYLPLPSASADNTDPGFDNSCYHAQPHPISVQCSQTNHSCVLSFACMASYFGICNHFWPLQTKWFKWLAVGKSVILPSNSGGLCSSLNTSTVNSLVSCGRRGGLMVSAPASGSSSPSSSPGRGHCVVSLGKTLYSHSASLHPGGVSHLSFATYHYNEKLFSMFAPTDYGWFVKTGWLILQVIAILFRI